MPKLMDWAASEWRGKVFKYREVPGAPTPTKLQVYAAYAATDTGGYGFMQGGGIYGHLGLEMEEAHRWWEMRMYVQGWLDATDGAGFKEFDDALRQEHLRVATLLGTTDEFNKAYPNEERQDVDRPDRQ
jgi:hypothetical protein